MSTRVIEVCILVASMAIAAAASAAETSLTSLSPVEIDKLKAQGTSIGALVAKLRERAANFLPTILLINTTGEAIASAMATLLLASLFPPPWNGLAAGAGFSLIVVIVCELTPKSIAVDKSVPVARGLARPVRFFSLLLTPVTFFVNGVVTILRFLIGAQGGVSTHREFTDEDLTAMMHLAEESGTLEADETREMTGVHKLYQLKAYSVMTAAEQVEDISADATLEEALQKCVTSRKSRLPVFDGSRDNVIGVLDAKHLLAHVSSMNGTTTVRELMRDPLYVPEWMRAHDLLARLKKENLQLAILLNEYGGTAGIVTMEDLLAEIVGDFGEEEAIADRKIMNVPGLPHAWVIDGSVRLDEVNEKCQTELQHNEVITVGGLVLSRLMEHRDGVLPERGSTFQFGTLRGEVVAMDGKRVKKVRIERVSDPTYNAPPAEEALALLAPKAGPADGPRQDVA